MLTHELVVKSVDAKSEAIQLSGRRLRRGTDYVQQSALLTLVRPCHKVEDLGAILRPFEPELCPLCPGGVQEHCAPADDQSPR